MNKKEILSEINRIHQYHDQHGDCHGEQCATCKILYRIEELFKRPSQTNSNQKLNKKYKCGHKSGVAIILKDSILSLSRYLEWVNNYGFKGDYSQCFDCYCKEVDSKIIKSEEYNKDFCGDGK